VKEDIKDKITSDEYDAAVTRCLVDNEHPLTSLGKSIYLNTMATLVSPISFEEGDRNLWSELPAPVQSRVLSFLGPPSTIEKRDVRVLASMIGSDASIIESQVSASSFRNVLYFQDTHPGLTHQLAQGSSVKDSHRSVYGVFGYVSSMTLLTITMIGCYIVFFLSRKPHGDLDKDEVPQLVQRCDDEDKSLRVIPDRLQRAILPDLQVFRETSSEMELPAIANFPKRLFLNFMRANASTNAVAVEGVRQQQPTISVDVGYSQPQTHSNHRLHHYPTRICLPHFKRDGIIFMSTMPPELRDAVGDLIMTIQNLVCQYNPDAMNDSERTALFSPIMSEYIFPNHPDIRFEYINFIVKAKDGGPLLNHMDYQNDARKGYSYCPVWWYLIDVEGVTYRVAIVMTFRNFCGVCMDKIANY